MKPKWDDKFKEVLHDKENIKGFCGEYRWLSNFESCSISFEGLEYTSSEAAYQSAKTIDMTIRKTFTNMDASRSKKAGKLIELRGDWNKVKEDVMHKILVDKFTRNPELKQKLIDTKDKYLEETNWWNDTFWGVCNGVGENKLGKNLMTIRFMISQW